MIVFWNHWVEERRGVCADRLLITVAMCLPTISIVDWCV